jgi:hypothetical protein
MGYKSTLFASHDTYPVSVFHTEMPHGASELYEGRKGWHACDALSDTEFAMAVWDERGESQTNSYENGVDVCVPQDTIVPVGQTVLIDFGVTAVCSKWERFTLMTQCVRAFAFAALARMCGETFRGKSPPRFTETTVGDGVWKMVATLTAFMVLKLFTLLDYCIRHSRCAPVVPAMGTMGGSCRATRNAFRGPANLRLLVVAAVGLLDAKMPGFANSFVVMSMVALFAHYQILPHVVCVPSVGFRLIPRSSFYKTGCIQANSIGVIDHGYRGTLRMPVHNTTNTAVTLKRGQFIAQLCGAPDARGIGVHYRKKERAYIPPMFRGGPTLRGASGFGSTEEVQKRSAL